MGHPAPSLPTFAERFEKLERVMDGGSGAFTVLAIGLVPDLLACIREQQAALADLLREWDHQMHGYNEQPCAREVRAVLTKYEVKP